MINIQDWTESEINAIEDGSDEERQTMKQTNTLRIEIFKALYKERWEDQGKKKGDFVHEVAEKRRAATGESVNERSLWGSFTHWIQGESAVSDMYLPYVCEVLGVSEDEFEPYSRTHRALYKERSEAGEVAGIMQKKYQGHSIDREHMAKELGDCLWMIAEICDAFGLSLAEVMGKNIEKLRERYPDGFEAEKSLHRKDGDI